MKSNMSKFEKKISIVLLVTVMLITSITAMASGSNSQIVSVMSDGKYPRKWTLTFSVVNANGLYQYNFGARQPQIYKFDTGKMESIIYVEGSTNITDIKYYSRVYEMSIGKYCTKNSDKVTSKATAIYYVNDIDYGSIYKKLDNN